MSRQLGFCLLLLFGAGCGDEGGGSDGLSAADPSAPAPVAPGGSTPVGTTPAGSETAAVPTPTDPPSATPSDSPTISPIAPPVPAAGGSGGTVPDPTPPEPSTPAAGGEPPLGGAGGQPNAGAAGMPEPEPGTGGVPSLDCDENRLACADECVDPESDDGNCGDCGVACDPGEQCVSGACQAETSDSPYPCDGSTDGYDEVVMLDGGDAKGPVESAFGRLSGGRSQKESVLVLGNGTVAANARINVPSYTLVNFCGTIDVVGSPSGDNAVVYGRGVRDIEIPNITITGSPAYGIFFRESQNLHFGQVDIRVSSGLGLRVDSGPNYSVRAQNVRIDDVYVEGTTNHGVETYGVDGLTIGTVVARNVGYSGLLLNQSTDAEVGLVDGDDVAAGQGYAVFRMANNNGEKNGAYPMNIHVGKVIARGGGRGIFCVTESGGATIDEIDIEDTGNNSILIESCYNITIGSESAQSRVANSGELRTAKRSDLPAPADILFQNIAVTGTSVREDPCVDTVDWSNVSEDGSLITSDCP